MVFRITFRKGDYYGEFVAKEYGLGKGGSGSLC